MALTKNYIASLIVGWGMLGGLSLLIANNFIGGGATFFLLLTFGSWTVLPLSHFIVAFFAAKKLKKDPSVVVTATGVSLILFLISGLLLSGLFNYV